MSAAADVPQTQEVGVGVLGVVLPPVVEGGKLSTVDMMDTLRKHEAYCLDNGDWASQCAVKLVQQVGGYLDDVAVEVPELSTDGLLDEMELYVRACREVSPAVSLELMLPAGYAYAGALSGGGLWVAWNGRGTWQVAPCTLQVIGLAPSGVGKSTQQKLLNLAYGPAASVHEGAVQKVVSDWAAACEGLVAEALAADAAAVQHNPNGEEFAELAKAKKVARKLVNSIDLDVSSGVKMEYSDTTAEALVSSAISFGGAAFIRSAEQDILDNLTRYSSGGGGASLTFLTDGFDGNAYSRDRRGSGFEHTSAMVVSMSLMTQTESFASSFAASGTAWLGKGLLGRAWVSRGAELDMDQMLAADLERRLAGVVPVPVSEALSDGLERLALAGAGARAARLLDDRLVRKAREAGPEASGYLKKALAACRGGAGSAVTVDSIALSDGSAGGLAGVVVQLGPEESARLEDLHAWLLRCFALCGREDPVLAPVVTRLTYQIGKVVGIRCGLFGPGVSVADVLADTAVRVVPWLLGMHLKALGGLVRGIRMEDVRRELVAGRGMDTSMGGQIVQALGKAGGVKFPCSVSQLVVVASRGHRGVRGFREGMKEYFRLEHHRQVVLGEPDDGYFMMGGGRKSGSVIVKGFSGALEVKLTPDGLAAVSGLAGGAGSGLEGVG